MQAIEAVLVTREDTDAGRSGSVAVADPFAPLADLGYTICHVPLTRTAAPSDPGPLDGAVRNLSEFSWIAFTSARAVQGFANAVTGSGPFGSAGTPGAVRIACVIAPRAAIRWRGVPKARAASNNNASADEILTNSVAARC